MAEAPLPATTRRTFLISAGVTGFAFCLAGCSQAGGPAVADGGLAPGGTVNLAKAAVPVGRGTIVGTFVVTQPTAGTFEAFSYLCTHQNLPVQQVTDQAIVCGRHGSTYSLTDGSVITGPATRPLARAKVTISGDNVIISA